MKIDPFELFVRLGAELATVASHMPKADADRLIDALARGAKEEADDLRTVRAVGRYQADA